jgi:hypothetical protein
VENLLKSRFFIQRSKKNVLKSNDYGTGAGDFIPKGRIARQWGGKAFPKARDKLVHSGISVPGRADSGGITSASAVLPPGCRNDP